MNSADDDDPTGTNRLARGLQLSGAARRALEQTGFGTVPHLLKSTGFHNAFVAQSQLERLFGDSRHRAGFASIARLSNFPKIGETLASQLAGMHTVTKQLRESTLADSLAKLGTSTMGFSQFAESLEPMQRLMAASPLSQWKSVLSAQTVIRSAVYATAAAKLSQGLITEIADADQQLQFIEQVLQDAAERAEPATSATGQLRVGPPELTWEQWLAIVSMIMTVLMFLSDKYDSSAMEARQAARIQAAQETTVRAIESAQAQSDARFDKIEDLLDQLAAAQPQAIDGPQYLVSADAVRVRAESGGSGAELAIVCANELVTCLDRAGKWRKIRYHDWLRGITVEGWVRKKHLYRLPAAPEGDNDDDAREAIAE